LCLTARIRNPVCCTNNRTTVSNRGGNTSLWIEHVPGGDQHEVFASERRLLLPSGRLTVRAEAADQESLRLIQDLLTSRLQKFGRREHLTVNWQDLGG